MNSRTTRDSDPADSRIRELLAIADRDTFEPSEGLLDRIQSSLAQTIDLHETVDDQATSLTPPGVSADTKPAARALEATTFGRLRVWATACVAAG